LSARLSTRGPPFGSLAMKSIGDSGAKLVQRLGQDRRFVPSTQAARACPFRVARASQLAEIAKT